MCNIVVTGSSGFVGRHTVKRLSTVFDQVFTLSRHQSLLSLSTKNIDSVIHLAARAHIVDKSYHESLIEFRKANVDYTLNLARSAASIGVKRFVFISTIGVNGIETLNSPFNANDKPSPHSAYAVSKYEAELGLQELAYRTGMEVVILRPPLVYGANAPGNFGLLMRCVDLGIPLPLGSVYNKRSFIAIDNLVDFILTCVSHPSAANEIFLVSDNEDISTTDLLRKIGFAIGHPARLFSVPTKFMTSAARLMGKSSIGQSLFGSLQIDMSKCTELLNWIPIISLDEGIKRSVKRDSHDQTS